MSIEFAVETEGLTRRFGRFVAVNQIDLAVRTGSIYALLGPNGAGKTTTIKMSCGILRPTRGRIRTLGHDATRLGPNELSGIGYVAEDQELPDWMTIRALLRFCAGLYPNWDDGFAELLTDLFDLPTGARIRDLSRGERMKTKMLCGLAFHPRLLFLDEPFGGIDVGTRDALVEGLLEMTGRERWTVLISSHDVDLVESLADQIGYIDRGRLLLSESLDGLRARFREIHVVLEPPAMVPNGFPASWWNVEVDGPHLSYVDVAHDPDRPEAAIRARLPAVRHLDTRPMSLRSICVALSRHHRRVGWRSLTESLERDDGQKHSGSEEALATTMTRSEGT